MSRCALLQGRLERAAPKVVRVFRHRRRERPDLRRPPDAAPSPVPAPLLLLVRRRRARHHPVTGVAMIHPHRRHVHPHWPDQGRPSSLPPFVGVDEAAVADSQQELARRRRSSAALGQQGGLLGCRRPSRASGRKGLSLCQARHCRVNLVGESGRFVRSHDPRLLAMLSPFGAVAAPPLRPEPSAAEAAPARRRAGHQGVARSKVRPPQRLGTSLLPPLLCWRLDPLCGRLDRRLPCAGAGEESSSAPPGLHY